MSTSLFFFFFLSLHADKLLGKVSLSPQRRSFQRGCSWKEKNPTSSDNNVEPGTPPTASPHKTSQSDQHFTFDSQKSHSYGSTQRHSNTSTITTTTTANTTPRVIHHTPLRDRGHSNSRKGWGSGHDNWEKSSRNNHVSCVISVLLGSNCQLSFTGGIEALVVTV